jgi:hypothetical protein
VPADEGGDVTALEIELHHATDQLTELEMTGQADEVIQLAADRPRTLNTAPVYSPWRPVSTWRPTS